MNTSDLVILFGGSCSERRVSVASAQHLSEVLAGAQLWFWTPQGSVQVVSAQALRAHERPFEHDFRPDVAPAHPSLPAALDAAGAPQLFVLALHGGEGEDGTVQNWLEARKLCFTGSGSQASRVAFDKAEAKRLVKKAGGRVAESALVSGEHAAGATRAISALVAKHGRAVVKPVADGSSAGLQFVSDEAGVKRALATLEAAPKVKYLIEPFIEGVELTVGVYDAAAGTRALPASEVRIERGRAFDFEGKYLGKGTKEITPAEVSKDVHAAAGALALLAHQTLGCLGYSRTDMIVDGQGPVFLEINNLPGVTRASFIPQQLAAAGISMREFMGRQIELGRKRYGEVKSVP